MEREEDGMRPFAVAPRKRRVSRNVSAWNWREIECVAPRKRRVSRNSETAPVLAAGQRRASQEACE